MFAQVDPRHVPVLAPRRCLLMLGEQFLPCQCRRGDHVAPAGHGPIERFGKAGGVLVVHRTVPTEHLVDAAADQLAHQGRTVARVGRGPGGGPAGRQNDQPHDLAAVGVGGGEGAGEFAGRNLVLLATCILEQENRLAVRRFGTVAGEVNDLGQGVFAGSQTQRQPVERTAFLDGQVQLLQAGGGLQNARLLGFEVERLLPGWRRRQEQQAEVAVLRLARCSWRPDAAGDFKGLGDVRRQVSRLGTGIGQQFPRRVVQQPAQPVAGVGCLQQQAVGAVLAQPRAQPAGAVEPARHLAADGEQFAVGVSGGSLVVAPRPVLQLFLCRIGSGRPLGSGAAAIDTGTQSVAAGGDRRLHGC